MARFPRLPAALSLAFLLHVAGGLLAATAEQPRDQVRSFTVKGTVEELKPDGKTVVIRHEAISNYMDAMTMPFRAADQKEVAGLHVGDSISFRLTVTSAESWIDQLTRLDSRTLSERAAVAEAGSGIRPSPAPNSLKDFKFTNELGQAVSLGDFHGQALAITFFFTRCPIPDFCPRLSKNFQAASGRLSSMPAGPTNWHFLSVTFDPENDSPAVLKAYAELYHYDPAHWSFLTGPSNRIAELARQSGLKFERDGAFFNHDFRTLIIDAANRLQMVFPMGGDLSDSIVEEILKAATARRATTNPPSLTTNQAAPITPR